MGLFPYNCVGSIIIPETANRIYRMYDVTINTRKGVNVTYAPANEEIEPLEEAV